MNMSSDKQQLSPSIGWSVTHMHIAVFCCPPLSCKPVALRQVVSYLVTACGIALQPHGSTTVFTTITTPAYLR